MSDEKTRFSARVREETLEVLDEEKERRGLNRSQTIERLVDEWESATGDGSAPEWWDRAVVSLKIGKASLVVGFLSVYTALLRPELAEPLLLPELVFVALLSGLAFGGYALYLARRNAAPMINLFSGREPAMTDGGPGGEA